MSILKPMPPVDPTTAFSNGLAAFLYGPDYGGAGTLVKQGYVGLAPTPSNIPTASGLGIAPTGVDLTAIETYNPQQVFVLGLSDAASNSGISAAVPAGWRFFAGHSSGTMVLARVAASTSAGAWRMTAAYYGARASEVFQASEQLESLPQITGGTYELRALSIPGLNLEAFWLLAKTPGTQDLVVPFPNGLDQPISLLQSPNPYQMAAFLAIIRPLAQQRLAAPATYGS